MTVLDLVQRFSAVRLSSPFPFEVLKGLKGEVVVVSRFGRTLLPKWKLHFLLNPLLPLVISASFSIRPLKEWVSQARLGPLDSTSEGFQLCRSESGKPGCSGVSSAAGFGWIASKPSHWSAPQCRQIWESSRISFRSPRAGCSSVGHIPPHLICQEASVMDVWVSNPMERLSPALLASLPWRSQREGLGSKNSFKINESNNNYKHIV